jgi:hypothetical protein
MCDSVPGASFVLTAPLVLGSEGMCRQRQRRIFVLFDIAQESVKYVGASGRLGDRHAFPVRGDDSRGTPS